MSCEGVGFVCIDSTLFILHSNVSVSLEVGCCLLKRSLLGCTLPTGLLEKLLVLLR